MGAPRRVVLAGAGPLSFVPPELAARSWSEFIAVGIGLAFGMSGAGAQVGAQLIAFAGRLGAHLVQHLLGVGADPLGFGPGGAGGGLGAGGLLLILPGRGLGVGCRLAGLVRGRLSAVWMRCPASSRAWATAASRSAAAAAVR